ncbi:DMT family transporter [bacterium]|nr:DMT family transporter [candidate division CSSED10-310 bacterium]
MYELHWGEIAALLTAVFWTVTALSFESAGKRVGSLSVNLIRLCMGLGFLSLYTWVSRGMLLPLDASLHAWIWLSLSGLVGFVLGDLFLFQAFVLIGSRISMLIMAAVPPLTAILGLVWMGERLTATNILGMTLTLTGIVMVLYHRNGAAGSINRKPALMGIVLAFAGAFGQALGLVLSKFGMGDYNPFAATQIRGIAGIAGFIVLFFPLRAWDRVRRAVGNSGAMKRIALGAFFGPFLGVSFSLWAVQYTKTGVAATIMACVPVLIIPPSILLFKEKVSIPEMIGAVVAVGGVGIMFV